MHSDRNKQSISYKVRKATDYHFYLITQKAYPEIAQLSDKDIVVQICKLFRDAIEYADDKGSLCYQYAAYGLIPAYEQNHDTELLQESLKQLEIAECSVHDCNLLRDIYVAKAKTFLLLNQLSLAEKYIFAAYSDYDYRTSTFLLLIKILDLQNKFDLMIKYLEQYCGEFANLHKKISYSDLDARNIKKSSYMEKLREIVGELSCSQMQIESEPF